MNSAVTTVRRVAVMAPSSLPSHHHRSVGRPLFEDWQDLARRTPSLDLDSLLTGAGFVPRPGERSADQAPPDEAGADDRLAGLVRDAATDTLAARVVLQRLLPGLLSIARRRGRGSWLGTHDAFDELLAAGWVVIRLYPIERRPARVAANLLRDIEYQAFTAPARRAYHRREAVTAYEDDTWVADDAAPDAFGQIVEILAEARAAGMDPTEIRFAAALASGRRLEDLAAERGVSVRAERYRRARVVARLRAVALDATVSAWGP